MSDGKNQLRTLSRGLDVLERIESAPQPQSLTELARAMGDSAPIIFRVLQTLEARGYVRRRESDKRYVHTGRVTGSGAITRALSLLGAIAQFGVRGGTVAELAAFRGFDESTVEELLQPLAERAVVEVNRQGEPRWRISVKVMELIRPLMTNTDVTSAVRPLMERLHAETGETLSLFRRVGNQQVLVSTLASPQPIRYVLDVGTAFPLTVGAAGKAELAYLTSRETDALLAKETPEAADAIRTELMQIRDRRYALSLGERIEGACAVAAAVRDAEGAVCGVVSLMAPSFRMTEARLQALGEQLVDGLNDVNLPATGEQFWHKAAARQG
ncbi:IclR family transcriptional regulator [Marinobacter mangrovi]|uniref:IclR family transcriptional regulator n=1 Tax=Marinobacter mangrovi TaxID=2803918 RepID=UPI001933F0B1|nr:IclR family transcriptional regulator [Marinobacter mangrovi]